MKKGKERPTRGNKEENTETKGRAKEARIKGKNMVIKARARATMEAKEGRKETKDGK